MITLKFYTFGEKLPAHMETIIYLQVGLDPVSMIETQVKYLWEDGNGTQICYDPKISSYEMTKLIKSGFKLSYIISSGEYMYDKSLWAPIEDIQSALQKL